MGNGVDLSNGRSWKTQKAATEYYRAIRDRYADRVPIDHASDHDDLAALLERYDTAHTDEDTKIGAGIDFFEVRTNRGFGGPTRGFWVTRTDGTSTDFSFPWAIRGVPKPQAQEFVDACRSAVDKDLKSAKRSFFAMYGDLDGLVPCEITGRPLSFDDAHIDHAHPSFGVLVIAFRAARGWHAVIPPGTLSKPSDNQLTTTFVDPLLVDDFRTYHHAAASLRMVCPVSNLARAAGQRRPKILRPIILEPPEAR